MSSRVSFPKACRVLDTTWLLEVAQLGSTWPLQLCFVVTESPLLTPELLTAVTGAEQSCVTVCIDMGLLFSSLGIFMHNNKNMSMFFVLLLLLVRAFSFIVWNRYVGVWPHDINRLTALGVAQSAWVVWTVLNATNDRAPKARRNTCVSHPSRLHHFSEIGLQPAECHGRGLCVVLFVCAHRARLFMNISVLVRIFTWIATKLGAVVLRGVTFDVRFAFFQCG